MEVGSKTIGCDVTHLRRITFLGNFISENIAANNLLTSDEEFFEHLEQTIFRTHLISVLVVSLLTIKLSVPTYVSLSEAYYLKRFIFCFTWLFQQACNELVQENSETPWYFFPFK